MKFTKGMRVQIVSEARCVAPPPVTVTQTRLAGKIGTVVRCLRRDDSAWVMMDDDLPDDLRLFPKSDQYGRGNNIILWPSECIALKTPNV